MHHHSKEKCKTGLGERQNTSWVETAPKITWLKATGLLIKKSMTKLGHIPPFAPLLCCSLLHTHILQGSPSPVPVSVLQAVIRCQKRPSSQEQLFVCLSSSSLSIPLSYSSSESSLCSRTRVCAHVLQRQQSRMLHLFPHCSLLYSYSFTCCSITACSLFFLLWDTEVKSKCCYNERTTCCVDSNISFNNRADRSD